MRKFAMGLLMLSSFGAVACGDPAIGSWSGSYDEDGTEIDVDMTLDKDGTGAMDISAVDGAVTINVEMDLEWEKTSKGEYKIDAKCSKVTVDPDVYELTCEEFDADGDTTCTLNDAKDELTCDDDEEEGEPVVLKAD